MDVALITGGNRGLGRAVAQALASRGDMRVVIGARDERSGGRAAAEIAQQGAADVSWIELDVTDRASVQIAAARLDRELGGIDVLVNNAGILPEATAEAEEVLDLELFEQTFRTNVFGAVAVTQAFLPQLRASSRGRIVNVSSAMGSLAEQVDPGSPYYSMVLPAYQSSKAALNSVTIALSKSLAGSRVTVTSVCPGFVQTDLTPVNRAQAPLTAEEAAQIVVQAATLPDGAASGTFIGHAGPVPW